MSMFKVGDRVRCIGCPDSYPGRFTPGKIYLVVEYSNYGDSSRWNSVRTDDDGSLVIVNHESIAPCFVREPESELERLVRVATEGFRAVDRLREKYSDQVECGSDKSGYDTMSSYAASEPGWTYRIKAKPSFKPFTVGQGWKVELKGDRLHIGCKEFPARDIAQAGREMRDCTEYFDPRFVLRAARNGIVLQGDYLHHISWADWDRIIAALEKAGVK